MNRQEIYEQLCHDDIFKAIRSGSCPICGCEVAYIPKSKTGGRRFLGDSYSLYYECHGCETEFEEHVQDRHSVTFRAYF